MRFRTKLLIKKYIGISLIILCTYAVALGSVYLLQKRLTKTEHIPVNTKNEIAEMLMLGYYNMTENEAEVHGMLFAKYAKKYKVDWRIFPALVMVESGWDASAISSSKAKGQWQILDSTFKDFCNRLNIPYKENSTIYNDILNETVGLEYISQAVKKMGMERGVKSYLGGPKFSESNADCKQYWLRFKAEYMKMCEISKEYERMDAYIINKALSN